jgi:hypothetical protein
MVLPRWLFFLVAAWVIAFGVFRFYLAATRNRPRREGQPDYRAKGLYARPARTHALYGVIYVLLGSYLLATGFGYGPRMGGGCGPAETTEPGTSLDSTP